MVPQKRTFSPKEIMNVMNLEILKIEMGFKPKTDSRTKRKGLVPRKKPLQNYSLSGKPLLRMG